MKREVRAPAVVLALAASAVVGACGTGTGANAWEHTQPANLVGDGGAPCDNLMCRQVDCAAQGSPTDTTLSGVVYDPAGKLPLYNVLVYVPLRTPDPIPAGNPTCSRCQAPASGSPLVSTLTDARGAFHLTHVPTGDHIPLVLQIGKWRRQIEVSHVEACTANTIDDPTLVRLPANSSEGDMPLIALATGCDAAECFLLDVGVNPAEFTGPSGSGHVHVFGGKYPGMTVKGMGDAYSLWSSPENLLRYDVVMAACECAEFPRDTEGPAYEAMHQYVNEGGRLYTTHFQYNWFAPPTGPIDFQNVADWDDTSLDEGLDATFFIDTSFPKGRAFGDWLEANGLSPEYGQVALTDTRDSVAQVKSATRWIYGGDAPTSTAYESKYLSFDTPIEMQPANQCGRATFSDVHLAGLSNAPGAFPDECAARNDPHGVDERTLEFLFFDLVSCIEDPTQPPSLPPTQ